MIRVVKQDGKIKTYKTKEEYLKDRPQKETTSDLDKLDIGYPDDYSEFEIQAYLYGKLKRMGFDARGEVSSSNGKGKGSRFDIVLYKKKKAYRIIEVKKQPDTNIEAQRIKYSRYGVKVTFIMGMDDALKYIKEVRLYSKYLRHSKKNDGTIFIWNKKKKGKSKR